MIDRLRVFLDRPLDPDAARATLVFASAILFGFAALIVLAGGQRNRPTSPHRPSAIPASPRPAVPPRAVELNSPESQASRRRQDPQDFEGSAAARRAARALRSHRAIQHVPYRHGELVITLTGSRGNRALLRVSATSLPVARRGWKAFLQRYHDQGDAYSPQFVAGDEGRGQ